MKTRTFSQLPRTVWLLAVCQSLGLSAGSMMVLIGSLLAARIAPTPKLATLPLAAAIIGTACSTIPAALFLRRFGRKRGSLLGYVFSFSAAGLGFFAATRGSFSLLVATGACMGVAVAFWQQFRFAALESIADPALYGPALSVMMGGGLLSAFLGPEIGAATGFGVMSFVMTATPLTMHEVCGFDLGDTKKVIQSHIVAMFLPSVFSGSLMQRFGVGRVMSAGAALYALVVLIGLGGQELMHFWGSLIVLGVGWNFLFMGGTALLPQSYAPTERFKVQAVNDFIVFGSQAAASLSSGWFVFTFGWRGLMLACLPFLGAALALSLWQARREAAS